MNLKNGFTEKTRMLFYYSYECFWCLMNSWDALHHILGRVSSSPLNAAPIHNHKCHVGNARLDSFESRSKLLKKTYAFLKDNNYQFTTEDKAFLKKNNRYYQ